MKRCTRKSVRAPRIMSAAYQAILRALVAARLVGAARAGEGLEAAPDAHHSALRVHLMPRTIHVIGAGLSGLAAAVRLTRARRARRRARGDAAGGRTRAFLLRRVHRSRDRQRQPSAALRQSRRDGVCAHARLGGGTGRSAAGGLRVHRSAERQALDFAHRRRTSAVVDARRQPPRARLDGHGLSCGSCRWSGRPRARPSATRSPARVRCTTSSGIRCCSPRSTSIRQQGSAALAGAIIRETLHGGWARLPAAGRARTDRGADRSGAASPRETRRRGALRRAIARARSARREGAGARLRR